MFTLSFVFTNTHGPRYALLPSEPSHLSQYYFGAQVTHGFEAYHVGEAWPSAARGYGRVRWRRDGFVSQTTSFDGSVGTLVTKNIVLAVPPTLATTELHFLLNAATSVSGSITVELLQGGGSVYGGGRGERTEHLSIARSLEFVGDSVNATVYFNATISDSRFTCATENAPADMPAPNDVSLVADVGPLFRAAGPTGLSLRLSLLDARLWSITFVEVPRSNL